MRTVSGVGRYAWDPDKEEINIRKHGVSFGEAEGVAESRSSWIRFDDAHSVIEPRFVVVGWSALGRLLLVITSNGGPRPRIISAQRATKREIDAYARR